MNQEIGEVCDRQGNKYRAYVFNADPLHILPKEYKSHFSLIEKAKLFLRSWRGFRFYQLSDGTKLCSYAFLKHNYLRKYVFLKKDWLINPYYTESDCRNRGLGEALLEKISEDLADDSIWAVVKADNLASQAVLKKVKFYLAGYSDKKGWFHKLTDRPTSLLVFHNKQEE